MVDELAAIRPPTISPTNPTGRNFSIAGIGDVVSEQTRVEVRERALDVGQLGIDEDGTEGDENPRPRPQHVVRDIEEEHRAERILLRLRRQHALRDVAAAARLRARDTRPPTTGRRWA